jgi:hypothetical protein
MEEKSFHKTVLKAATMPFHSLHIPQLIKVGFNRSQKCENTKLFW